MKMKMQHQNLWNIAKALLEGKQHILHSKGSLVTALQFHLWELEKDAQTKPKASEGK